MQPIQSNRFKVSCYACLLVVSVFSPAASAVDLQGTFELAQKFDPTIKAAEYDYESAIERLPLARSACSFWRAIASSSD